MEILRADENEKQTIDEPTPIEISSATHAPDCKLPFYGREALSLATPLRIKTYNDVVKTDPGPDGPGVGGAGGEGDF